VGGLLLGVEAECSWRLRATPPPAPGKGATRTPTRRNQEEGARDPGGPIQASPFLLVGRKALGGGRCRAAGAAPRPPPSSPTASARPQGGAKKSYPSTITLQDVLNTDFIIMATILVAHNFTATPIGSWVAPSIQFATPPGGHGVGQQRGEICEVTGQMARQNKEMMELNGGNIRNAYSFPYLPPP